MSSDIDFWGITSASFERPTTHPPKPWHRVPVSSRKGEQIYKRAAGLYFRERGDYGSASRELQSHGATPRKRTRQLSYVPNIQKAEFDQRVEVDHVAEGQQVYTEAIDTVTEQYELIESSNPWMGYRSRRSTFPERHLTWVPQKRHNTRWPVHHLHNNDVNVQELVELEANGTISVPKPASLRRQKRRSSGLTQLQVGRQSLEAIAEVSDESLAFPKDFTKPAHEMTSPEKRKRKLEAAIESPVKKSRITPPEFFAPIRATALSVEHPALSPAASRGVSEEVQSETSSPVQAIEPTVEHLADSPGVPEGISRGRLSELPSSPVETANSTTEYLAASSAPCEISSDEEGTLPYLDQEESVAEESIPPAYTPGPTLTFKVPSSPLTSSLLTMGTPRDFRSSLPDIVEEPAHETHRRQSLQNARRSDRRSSAASVRPINFQARQINRRHSGLPVEATSAAKNRRHTLGPVQSNSVEQPGTPLAEEEVVSLNGSMTPEKSERADESSAISPTNEEGLSSAIDVDVNENLDIFGGFSRQSKPAPQEQEEAEEEQETAQPGPSIEASIAVAATEVAAEQHGTPKADPAAIPHKSSGFTPINSSSTDEDDDRNLMERFVKKHKEKALVQPPRRTNSFGATSTGSPIPLEKARTPSSSNSLGSPRKRTPLGDISNSPSPKKRKHAEATKDKDGDADADEDGPEILDPESPKKRSRKAAKPVPAAAGSHEGDETSVPAHAPTRRSTRMTTKRSLRSGAPTANSAAAAAAAAMSRIPTRLPSMTGIGAEQLGLTGVRQQRSDEKEAAAIVRRNTSRNKAGAVRPQARLAQLRLELEHIDEMVATRTMRRADAKCVRFQLSEEIRREEKVLESAVAAAAAAAEARGDDDEGDEEDEDVDMAEVEREELEAAAKQLLEQARIEKKDNTPVARRTRASKLRAPSTKTNVTMAPPPQAATKTKARPAARTTRKTKTANLGSGNGTPAPKRRTKTVV